jgi:multidrug transporter EmrE-like cation transporter
MNYLYIHVLLITLFETVGDIGFKYYAKNNNWENFTLGISGYIGVCYYLIQSFQQSNILIVNGMWDGFSTLFEGAIAFFILGERLVHVRQYIGYILITIGLFLLVD